MSLDTSRHRRKSPMKKLAQMIIDQRKDEDIIIQRWEDMEHDKPEVAKYHYHHDKKLTTLEREKGSTLLHLAAAMPSRSVLARRLIESHPAWIIQAREDKEYKGQTPFHIAIACGNEVLVDLMLEKLEDLEATSQIMELRATGTRLKATTMMGELPLSIAAVQAVYFVPVDQFGSIDSTTSISYKLIDMLLEFGADPSLKNNKGNTVFHTLVLYAFYYKHKADQVINVMKHIMEKVREKERETETEKKRVKMVKSLLSIMLIENSEELTPLRMAAKHGLKTVFNFILEYEELYKHLDFGNGVIDICDYDITEIDKVAMKNCMLKSKESWEPSTKNVRDGGLSQEDESQAQGWAEKVASEVKLNLKKSVLDMICNLPVHNASEMLQIHTIEEIIYLKWRKYRRFYYLWGFFHLLLMSLLTTHSVFKAAAMRSLDIVPIPYIIFINIVCIAVAVVYICLEVMRSLVSHQPLEITNLHHNGIYRVLFIMFSFCLLVDGIWNIVSIDNNYFLIVALLLGWWFNVFFLRGLKQFSFFTLMINRIIFGDMLRFSLIIIFQLISFTAAMHVTLLYTTPQGPQGFSTYWTSLLTMFKLMIGLEEMNEIEESTEAWLAITLFILFLIVTFILLLNALIAMMSKTCEMTSTDRDSIWKLQRLSVILFIEGTLLQKHRCLCGWKKMVSLFDSEKKGAHKEQRYFIKVSNVSRDLLNGTSMDTTHADRMMMGTGKISALGQEAPTRISSTKETLIIE